MKSPFPGMDPYIEGTELWEDFHDVLIGVIHERLASLLPPGYVVRMKARDYIQLVEPDGRRDHQFRPDVAVRSHEPPRRPKKAGRRVAVAEPDVDQDPLEVRAFITESHREKFVEIYQREGGPRLVTSIEILSPANKKPGSAGRAEYIRKRESLLLGDVHLVEIDLLRGGQRMPMVDPWPDSPYVLMVSLVDPDCRCQVWRGHSARPLPSVPIPLIDPTPEIRLDLQAAVDTVYERGKYGESIDYSKPLPSLTPQESALAAASLKPRRR